MPPHASGTPIVRSCEAGLRVDRRRTGRRWRPRRAQTACSRQNALNTNTRNASSSTSGANTTPSAMNAALLERRLNAAQQMDRRPRCRGDAAATSACRRRAATTSHIAIAPRRPIPISDAVGIRMPSCAARAARRRRRRRANMRPTAGRLTSAEHQLRDRQARAARSRSAESSTAIATSSNTGDDDGDQHRAAPRRAASGRLNDSAGQVAGEGGEGAQVELFCTNLRVVARGRASALLRAHARRSRARARGCWRSSCGGTRTRRAHDLQ